jgi:DNA polymerase elongation subunit (family B)
MKNIIDIYPDFGGTWKLLKVTRDGETKVEETIENFRDYFYVAEDRLKELTSNPDIEKEIEEVVVYNNEKRKPLFCNSTIYKIYVRGIWSKNKIMKFLNYDLRNIFEIDVDSVMRYTIDHIDKIEKTNYKTLFFDIETTTTEGFPDWEKPKEKITCISMYNNFSEQYESFILKPKEMEDERTISDNKKVYFFDDEKEMLECFLTKVEEEDFDILTAWNISFDLTYIYGRCRYLGLQPSRLSPYGKFEIKKKMNKQQREETYIQISGRFVIDLLLRYKNIIFKEISSYSLEYVSELELGSQEKKQKVLDFTKEWNEHLDRLIDYSIKDVELLVKLDSKLSLINYLEELRLINNLPNIYYAETAKNLIDISLFRTYGDRIIFPSKLNLDRVQLGGGYLQTPSPGVYDWIAVYDFKGLYPSLIRTFNLSKETIVDEKDADFVTVEDDVEDLPKDIGREGFKVGWSLKEKGIIPTILESVLQLRADIKKEQKKYSEDSIEYRELDLKQYALKAPINANYGVNAYPGFRLYEPKVAATITYLGRKLNKYCSERIEEDFGLRVLYNDTDSFFVEINKADKELMDRVLKAINEKYVLEFVDKVGNGKIKNNYIEVEFEKTYEKLLLVKKRRYLGKKDSGKWDYKGIDLKRSNIPECIRECLQLYIDNLFKNKEKRECVIESYELLVKNIKENNIDKFKVPLKISKDYVTNLPQKRAADWANKNLNTSLKKGSKFYGLWTEGVYDIIGFLDIDQIKELNITIDSGKYRKVLIDKIENLNSDDYKIDFLSDINQNKLSEYI